jgi:hypothetical protein
VKDDGNYDWDTTDGHIADPYAVAAPEGDTDGDTDGGPNPGPKGGCDAGFGVLVLGLLPLLTLGRKRKSVLPKD